MVSVAEHAGVTNDSLKPDCQHTHTTGWEQRSYRVEFMYQIVTTERDFYSNARFVEAYTSYGFFRSDYCIAFLDSLKHWVPIGPNKYLDVFKSSF